MAITVEQIESVITADYSNYEKSMAKVSEISDALVQKLNDAGKSIGTSWEASYKAMQAASAQAVAKIIADVQNASKAQTEAAKQTASAQATGANKAAKANERLSASLADVEKNLKGVQQASEGGTAVIVGNTNKMRQSTEGASASLTDLLGGFLKFRVATAVWSEITDLTRAATQAMIEYDEQTARTTRIIGVQNRELIGQALRLGTANNGGVDIKQAGEVYYQLGTYIHSTDEILKAYQSTLNLVNGTEGDARTTTRATIQIFEQFGSQLGRNVGDGEKMRRANELLAISFKDSSAEIGENANALKYLGPIAETAGIKVEQLFATMTALTAQGVRGRMEGTEAGAFITRLIKSYDAAKQGIEQSGSVYHFTEARNDKGGLDLLKTLQDIYARHAQLLKTDTVAAEKYITAIGGSAGAVRFLGGLTEETFTRIKTETDQNIRATRGMTDEVGKLNKAMQQTIGHSASAAWAGFLGVLSSGLDDVAKKLGLIQSLNGIAQNFADSTNLRLQNEVLDKQFRTSKPLAHAQDMLGIVNSALTVGSLTQNSEHRHDGVVMWSDLESQLLPTQTNALSALLPKKTVPGILPWQNEKTTSIADLQALRTNLEAQVKQFAKTVPDAIRNMALGIHTPDGQASCAFFASKLMHQMGENVPGDVGSATALRDKILGTGGKKINPSQMQAGDYLYYTGPHYGTTKDANGNGHHAAVYIGNGMMAQKSGYQTSIMSFRGNPEVYRPGPIASNALAVATGAGAYKGDSVTKDASKQADAIKNAADNYRKMLLIRDKDTEAARLNADIVTGSYEGITASQKVYLLGLATQVDRMQSAQKQGEEYRKMMDGLGDKNLEFVKTLALGTDATDTQTLAFELHHEALTGFNAEQRRAIRNAQELAIAQSRQVEVNKALSSLYSERALLKITDTDRRGTIDAVGGLAQWQQMKPGEQNKALSLFVGNAQQTARQESAKTIADLTRQTSLLGDATLKAAQDAAGGAENWRRLSPALQATLTKSVSLNEAMTSLSGMKEQYGVSIADTLKPAITESDKANSAIARLMAKFSGLKDVRIDNIVGQVRDLAATLDRTAAGKLFNELRGQYQSRFDDFTARKNGTFDPVAAHLRDWEKGQKDNPAWAAMTDAQRTGMRGSEREAFVNDRTLQGITQFNEALGQAQIKAAQLTAADPFQRYLLSLYKFNEETQKFQLPPGLDPERLRGLYAQEQQTEGLQRMNQMQGELVKRAMELRAADPYHAWLVSLYEVDQITGEVKLPAGLDPARLKQIYNQQTVIDTFGQFTEGVSSLFGNMLQNTGQGFSGLFSGVYGGFRSLLTRMASEYLQGQLQHALSSSFGGLFGIGNPAAKGDTNSGGGILSGLFGIGGSVGSLFGANGPVGVTGQNVNLSTGSGSLFGSDLFKGFASGGTAPNQGWYVTGERGPELAYASGGQTRIYSNGESRNIAAASGSSSGGGDNHFHISMNVNANDAGSFQRSQGNIIRDLKARTDREYKRTR